MIWPLLFAGLVLACAYLLHSSRRTLRTLARTLAERDAQAALLQRERDFAARLANTTPAIVLLLDPHGIVQHANPFFEQLSGWRLDEIRGRDWFEACLPPRDRDRIREVFRAALHTPTRGMINAVVTRHGEERHIEWNDEVLRDEAGRTSSVLAIGIDVTDRERASLALRESEARTRQILDGLYGFVGVYAPDGTLVDANETPLRAAGLKRAEVIGRPFWETYWWNYDPGVQAGLKDALLRAARGETVRYEPVARMLGGSLMTVDLTFGPLRDSAGDITHVLGFAVDITERKRGEAALQAIIREKSTLLEEVHHRVKNNLQVISSLLFFEQSQAGAAETAAKFQRARDRISTIALVHERLYQSPDLNGIDFFEYVSSLGGEILQGLSSPSGHVALKVEGRAFRLGISEAVPAALIVNELLTNSLKHAFPDGRPGTVTVRLELRPDGERRIWYADDGVGPPDGALAAPGRTLGQRLIRQLVEQLRAGFVREPAAPGLRFLLTIPPFGTAS